MKKGGLEIILFLAVIVFLIYVLGAFDGGKMNQESFNTLWARFEALSKTATPKEVAELFYRKGVIDGKEAVLNEIRPLVKDVVNAATDAQRTQESETVQ